MKKLTIFIAAAAMLVACSSRKPKAMTPDELYAECASGVVLVINQSYEQLTLPNGMVFYTSRNYGGLTDNEAIVRDTYPFTATSTGFFISDNGKIFCGYPADNDSEEYDNYIDVLEGRFIEFKYGMADEINDAISTWSEELEQVNYRINNADFWGQTPAKKDTDRRMELEKKIAEQQAKLEQWQSMSFYDDNVKIKIINSIYIAYNNTSVANINELEECEVVEGDDGYTIIQLKSRKPLPNTHLFDLKFKGELTENQPLYLLGFTEGVDYIKGVKAALTIGRITVQPVIDQPLNYSFPNMTLAAAGCPVLDAYGNVVAINVFSDKGARGIQIKTYK